MFVFGRFSMIEDVNEAACNLLGYARSELVERHGSELMPPEARRMAGLSVDQMRRGESEGCRGRLVRKDGSLVSVEVRARPLPKGRLILTVRPVPDDAGGRSSC